VLLHFVQIFIETQGHYRVNTAVQKILISLLKTSAYRTIIHTSLKPSIVNESRTFSERSLFVWDLFIIVSNVCREMDYLQWDAEVAVRMPFTAGLDFDIERVIYEGKDCVACEKFYIIKNIFLWWHINPLASRKNVQLQEKPPALKRESSAL